MMFASTTNNLDTTDGERKSMFRGLGLKYCAPHVVYNKISLASQCHVAVPVKAGNCMSVCF